MAPETFRPVSTEVGKLPERKTTTPEQFITDNHSGIADEGRREWNDNRAAGELYTLDACGDSRGKYPLRRKSASMRSIGAGGHKENKIITSRGIKYSVSASHFDGDKFKPGIMPVGCGGLGTSELLKKNPSNAPAPIKGILFYIARRIPHPDPLVQALLSANKITKETTKPSLVIAQDHLIGKIYPIGVMLPKKAPICNVNLIDLFYKYDPKEIYEEGIPELERGKIPDMFQEFLEAGEAYSNGILRLPPTELEAFKESQRVQNPHIIIATDELMSAALRYPTIASQSGSIFKIFLTRATDGNGEKSFSPETIDDLRDQLEYPIQHSIDHFKKPGKDFNGTNLLLIETFSMKHSLEIVQKLAEEEFIRNWLSLEDHHLYLGQTQEGITQDTGEFQLA